MGANPRLCDKENQPFGGRGAPGRSLAQGLARDGKGQFEDQSLRSLLPSCGRVAMTGVPLFAAGRVSLGRLLVAEAKRLAERGNKPNQALIGLRERNFGETIHDQ